MMRLLSIIIFLPLIFWGADGPPPLSPRSVTVDSFAEIAWDALAPLTPELVILPGVYHETLTVRASGTAQNPLRITVAGPVTIDGAGVRQSGIDISGQSYVTVDGRGLLRLQGHTGERVGAVEVRHASHVAITGVVIANAQSRGIFFDAVDDSRIADCEIMTGDVSNGVQTDGIYLQFGSGNVVEGNTVILGNNGTDHNDALQAANGESDLIVRNNWLAHAPGRGNSASQGLIIERPVAPVYVYNNVITGSREAWQVALFKDVAPGGVYHIWNNTIIAQHSRSVPLRLYNTVDAGLAAAQNNILVSQGAPAMMNDNGAVYGVGKIDHNLIYGTTTASRIGGWARTWAEHQAAGYDVHGVSAEPGFTDGYRLVANSPAIDRGAAVGSFATDRDGDARPAGGGWDIGADEFAGVAAVAPTHDSPIIRVTPSPRMTPAAEVLQ